MNSKQLILSKDRGCLYYPRWKLRELKPEEVVIKLSSYAYVSKQLINDLKFYGIPYSILIN